MSEKVTNKNKRNLIQNLDFENISNFSNKEIKKEKKKTIVIIANNEIIKRFIEVAFNYYRKNQKLSEYSYANFFPIALAKIEELLKEKYDSLEEPSEDYLNFYKKKSKGNNPKKYYILDNLEKISFYVNEVDSKLYYKLLHNFYIKERSDLTTFSISLFFYDIVNMLEKSLE